MFSRQALGSRWAAVRPGFAVLAAVAATLVTPLAAAGAQASARVVTGSGVAPGGTWGKAQQLPGIAALSEGEAEFTHLSCGSPGNCAGGGYYTDSGGNQYAFVTAEVNGTWQKARPVPGIAALGRGGQGNELDTVSCTRSGYCVAGGYYWTKAATTQAFVISEVNGRWGTAEEVPGTAQLNQGGGAFLAAVSCSSAGNCSAGGGYTDAAMYGQAYVISEVNGAWQDAREVPGTRAAPFSTRDPEIDSISCASAGNCGAGGDVDSPQTAFVVSEKNGRWQRAELVPGLDALNTGSYALIADVSCPSAGNCGAGGLYLHLGRRDIPDYHAFVLSEVNGHWGEAREVTGFAAFHGQNPGISSLSCGSPGNCSAVGTSGTAGQASNQAFVVSEHAGAWGQARLAPGVPVLPPHKGFVVFGGISCAAPGDCSAGGSYEGGDGQAHAFVIGQTDGTWGTAEQVPGTAALDQGGSAAIGALACASPGHCSAGGWFTVKHSARSQIFVVSET